MAWVPPAEPAQTIGDLADRLEAAEGLRIRKRNASDPASLLFVVAASSATVAKTEDGHTLSFELSALTSSIAFTDRPQRRAFDLTIPTLATLWGEGDNSFADDPPNAVLKDSGSKAAVTEIIGLSVDGGTVTFQLDRLDYRSVDTGDPLVGKVDGPTLVIDSLITVAGVAGVLRTAASGCAEVDCYLWPLGG